MELNTPDFPRWTVTRDGRKAFVHTTEELLALRGRFAWGPWWERRILVRSGPRVVVAMKDFDYAGWECSKGEVFQLQGRLEDPELLELKVVRPLSTFHNETSAKHGPTGRFFMNAMCLHDYTQRYEAHIRGDAVVEASERERQEPPTRHSARQRGRRKGTTYHTRERLPEALKVAYWNCYDPIDGIPPSMVTVAQALIPPIDGRTLRNYLSDWPEIQYPPPQ